MTQELEPEKSESAVQFSPENMHIQCVNTRQLSAINRVKVFHLTRLVIYAKSSHNSMKYIRP